MLPLVLVVVDDAAHVLAERSAYGRRERVVVGQHETEARATPGHRHLRADLVPKEQVARGALAVQLKATVREEQRRVLTKSKVRARERHHRHMQERIGRRRAMAHKRGSNCRHDGVEVTSRVANVNKRGALLRARAGEEGALGPAEEGSHQERRRAPLRRRFQAPVQTSETPHQT